MNIDLEEPESAKPLSEIDLEAALILGAKINEELKSQGLSTEEELHGCHLYGLTTEDLRKNCCNDMDGTKLEESSLPEFSKIASKHGAKQFLANAYFEGQMLRVCNIVFSLKSEGNVEVVDEIADDIMQTSSFQIEWQEGAKGTFWFTGHAE